MLLLLVIASILSLFAPPIGADCLRTTYWHWWFLVGINAAETILMLVLAVITYKLKKKQENQHPYFSTSKPMMEQKDIML